MNTRRRFISIVPLAGATWLAACGDKAAAPQAAQAPTQAPAAAPTGGAPMVNPADPEATALSYSARGSESKHEKYAPPSACGNCVMYGGKPGEEAGPCPLFIGKRVAAVGWCSAHNKRG